MLSRFFGNWPNTKTCDDTTLLTKYWLPHLGFIKVILRDVILFPNWTYLAVPVVTIPEGNKESCAYLYPLMFSGDTDKQHRVATA